jgi:hypothetical protein
MSSTERLLLAGALLTAGLAPLAAQVSLPTPIEMQNVVRAGPPRFLNRRVLLSYQPESPARPVRLVGASFEHQNYGVFHPYVRNANGVFLLLLDEEDIPEGLPSLTYRISVDGLWTDDPANPQRYRDFSGVVFSTFSLEGLPPRSLVSPEIRPNGEVTFRFRGLPGRFVSLIGEFNRWDPFWEPMREQPGRAGQLSLYQITLRLPPGPHYYVFSVDGERVPDPLNVEMAQDSEGFRVSTFQLLPVAAAPAR